MEKYVTGIQRGTETMQCVYMYKYIYTGVKYILFIHSPYLSTFARALYAFAYCVCGADEWWWMHILILIHIRNDVSKGTCFALIHWSHQLLQEACDSYWIRQRLRWERLRLLLSYTAVAEYLEQVLPPLGVIWRNFACQWFYDEDTNWP